jgi:hypothetical protein
VNRDWIERAFCGGMLTLCLSCGTGAKRVDLAGPSSQLDRIAESYVRLVLAVGQYDPEYVDSYYGPREWMEQAEGRKMPLAEIRLQIVRARKELGSIDPSRFGETVRSRLRLLEKQLASVETRIDLLSGVKMTFDQESAALFDAVAPEYPEAYFQAALSRAEAQLPGTGPLRERNERFRQRFIVPREKLDPVFRAAVREARSRTRQHIQLPEDESVRIEYVTGKPWHAYSRCVGSGQSVIQLNTDVPYTIDELLDLVCHETYPGHHVNNLLADDRLLRKRRWIEFSVLPLHSPRSLVSEGTAVHSMELAFPMRERVAFEREVLYPLAGLDPSQAEANARTHEAMEPLTNPWLCEAAPPVGRGYMDGLIGRSEMLDWLSAHFLISPSLAEMAVKFLDQYRSYAITYTVGSKLVKGHIEKHAGADRERQWQEFEKLLSSPIVPSDLR